MKMGYFNDNQRDDFNKRDALDKRGRKKEKERRERRKRGRGRQWETMNEW